MTPIELHTLRVLLEGLNVPEARLDLDKPSNVRWLLRNLAINNPRGMTLTEAIGRLRQLQREQGSR
jgi:hypothetical protein